MDHRPQAERVVGRALFAAACVVVGFTLLGAAAFAEVVIHLTRPKES
jgi:hypothetical protein